MNLALPLCLGLLVLASSEANVEVVDLTYDFGAGTVVWPGLPAFNFTILARGNTSGFAWFESNSFSTPEHRGTHVDSPSHLYEGSWRVHQIPGSHLAGPAAVVDVRTKAAANPDYRVSVKDIEDWEHSHGRLPSKCILIMNSGWGTRYPNASLVFNTATPNDPTTFHFPGIHEDLATFLTTKRDIIAVGVDTPSTDHGPSTTFPTHVIFGRNNVLGLENMANVDRLPARGATVMIGLIKLVDGSGGPARILGLVGDGADVFGGGQTGRGYRSVLTDVLVCWVVLLCGWFGDRW